MAEKFYVIRNDSVVYEDYQKFKQDADNLMEIFNEFATEKGIEAETFDAYVDKLVINPTEADSEKFKNQLKSDGREFKLSSPISRSWIKRCRDKKAKEPKKPFIPYILGCLTKSYWRLFEVKGVLYCTFNSDGYFEAPEDFIELKGSEFYTIMESYGVEL